MIVIKTKMTKLPNSCKECDLRVVAHGVMMCPINKDWLETWEYRNGKTKLDNCPLEEMK